MCTEAIKYQNTSVDTWLRIVFYWICSQKETVSLKNVLVLAYYWLQLSCTYSIWSLSVWGTAGLQVTSSDWALKINTKKNMMDTLSILIRHIKTILHLTISSVSSTSFLCITNKVVNNALFWNKERAPSSHLVNWGTVQIVTFWEKKKKKA